MNTSQAAALAGVTARTVRRWAAAGCIAAERTPRGWDITPAPSVTIGRRTYTLQETAITAVPITLTTKTRTPGLELAAYGDQAELAQAFESGAQVTLAGKVAGERVYLGHTRQTYDDGISLETIGLDHILGESPKYPGHVIAAYAIDMSRLQDAPTLAALKAAADAKAAAAAAATEARIAEEDARLEAPAEDGA